MFNAPELLAMGSKTTAVVWSPAGGVNTRDGVGRPGGLGIESIFTEIPCRDFY